MVERVNRRGLFDWIVQRVTALLIFLYTLVVVIFALTHGGVYSAPMVWASFLSNPGVRFFTVVTLFSVLWHTWIGLWTVFTDYIHHRAFRYCLNGLLAALLIFYGLWGLFGIFRGGY